jgi:hypothetical protein
MPGSPEDTELYEAYGPRFLAKADGFVPWPQGRPLVWFEDEAEEKAATPWPVSRIWSSGWTRARAWLARLHLDEAQRWLLASPVCGVY